MGEVNGEGMRESFGWELGSIIKVQYAADQNLSILWTRLLKQLPFIILPYPFSSSTLQYSDLLSPYSSANTSNNIVNIPYVHQQPHRKDKNRRI